MNGRHALVILWAAAAATACGGGGTNDVPATAPVPQVQTAAPTPAPTSAPTPAPSPAPVVAQPTCTPTKLTQWYARPLAARKIALSGDSTTSEMFTAGAFATGDPATLPIPAEYAAQLPGATLYNFGVSGENLARIVADPTRPRGINAIVAAAPDVIVLSYGINDVRIVASQTALEASLRSAVNAFRSALPNTDIVLRMPNSFLAGDVNGANFVTPNTPAQAQAYTDMLRGAYRAVANDWPNVALYESQALLFGETVVASSPYMRDQIHPSTMGYESLFRQVVSTLTIADPCH